MKIKKLEQHAKKLFMLDKGYKIACVIGCKSSFVSKIKNGRSYLPSKYIPALVSAYGSQGITEEYLLRLTKDGGL